MVNCLTLFAIFSLVKDFRAANLTSELMNDSIRPLGKPRMIIADNGPPGMTGQEWGDLPHAFCIQRAHSTTETPQQNGLMERASRSIKIALQQLLLDVNVQPSHALITQVTMARNHSPHTVAGIPPALAMTGRSDLLEWLASTAWNHDPHSIGPVVLQLNSMRRMLNARNAIITADAKRELVTCTNRNLPDRIQIFGPIGSSVQIASRNQWVGTFRVVGRSPSNLIMEKRKKRSPNGQNTSHGC